MHHCLTKNARPLPHWGVRYPRPWTRPLGALGAWRSHSFSYTTETLYVGNIKQVTLCQCAVWLVVETTSYGMDTKI